MTGFERYDVLTALFPFIEIPVRKPRPVLVLSGLDFNLANGHVVIVMITTGARSRWPSDCPIDDLASAGLQHRSVVRRKLFTVSNAQIGKRIGRLSESDRSKIGAHLDRILCGQGAPVP